MHLDSVTNADLVSGAVRHVDKSFAGLLKTLAAAQGRTQYILPLQTGGTAPPPWLWHCAVRTIIYYFSKFHMSQSMTDQCK